LARPTAPQLPEQPQPIQPGLILDQVGKLRYRIEQWPQRRRRRDVIAAAAPHGHALGRRVCKHGRQHTLPDACLATQEHEPPAGPVQGLVRHGRESSEEPVTFDEHNSI